MRPIDDLLQILSEAPDTQIDHTITPKLSALVGKPHQEISNGLKVILDECAAYALASDFAIMAMACAHADAMLLSKEEHDQIH